MQHQKILLRQLQDVPRTWSLWARLLRWWGTPSDRGLLLCHYTSSAGKEKPDVAHNACVYAGIQGCLPYRQRPGDEGNTCVAAAEDEQEEDGGEHPESDGHKHHPAICWCVHEDGAGYQRPVDQPQELQHETNYRSNWEEKLRYMMLWRLIKGLLP